MTRETRCPKDFADRLDRALPRLFAGLSRVQARKLISAGSVFIDGKRCRVSSRIGRAGARLLVADVAETRAAALRILFEDEDCIAVDKPAGMPSAPTRQAAAGTALELLRSELQSRGVNAQLWLVHRLDRDTSGVLLFARTKSSARRLDAAFRNRDVEKEYLAWVSGVLDKDAGAIEKPIRLEGKRVRCDPSGYAAETHWSVAERAVDRTLVRLLPSTGRMHQLRVHLQSIGHPVLGDQLYGGSPAPRLMLHAMRLRFPHPKREQSVEVVSSPTDLLRFPWTVGKLDDRRSHD